jgi:hypothetical protein
MVVLAITIKLSTILKKEAGQRAKPTGFSILWGSFRLPDSAASSAIGLPLRVEEIIYKKRPTWNFLPGRPFFLQIL